MIGLSIVPDVIEGTGAASIAATATLADAARRLAAEGDALAVVDEAGKLSGLIDAGTIVAAIAAAGAAALEILVGAVARGVPDVLAPGDSGLDALELMRLRGVDHLPVVDADGGLVGIVSSRRMYELLHRWLEREFDRQAAGVFGTPGGW